MTAVLLAEPLTPEWYEQRRRGIGASEIAAVLGISPWESPFSLYWRKANGWETDPTAEMSDGQRLEPVIANWWTETWDPNENLAVVPCGLVAHPERPWQLATPDRTIHEICHTCEVRAPEWYGCSDCMNTQLGSPPLAVLECKYVAHSWDGWGEAGTDQIPVHHRAQVLWQCDVVGVDQWYLAAFGPGGFRPYLGRSDERDLAVMREYGRRFMDRLESGDPPPIDEHTATLATLKQLHPDLREETAVVPEDVAEGYLRAVRMQRLAQRLVDRYEVQVRAWAGSARRIESWSGRKIATHVITDVAESTVTRAAHRRDYLLPPRSKP